MRALGRTICPLARFVCSDSVRFGAPGRQLTRPRAQDKVKTKYDRMFNRKSQTVLSEHYSKLIDRSDDPSAAADDDAFITLKRADHALEFTPLPASYELSKRKLKMGQSKKAMLSSHGNPTKLVFDDDGASHAIYELAGEEDFKADGDAGEQQRKFVEEERERLKERDVADKERAKEKRREKKRKRKESAGSDVRRFPFYGPRYCTSGLTDPSDAERRGPRV